MQWFQIKEKSAGKKRLILSWYMFKMFGAKSLYLIAFFVSFFTVIFSSDIRLFSKKYFETINNYTGLKPSLFNTFKLVNSYANSLVDKLLAYTGNYNPENIIFENDNDKTKLHDYINQKKGIFFICSHIGNIEVLQSMFFNKNTKIDSNINVFISNSQSKIFNSFVKKVKREFPAKIFSVEEIGIETGITLKENLDKGEIVFIAGDRISENNTQNNVQVEMFNKKALIPKGTFKLAKLMNTETYFISAIKTKNGYKIYTQKQDIIDDETMIKSYINYLEMLILKAPFQFYHFYDFFND